MFMEGLGLKEFVDKPTLILGDNKGAIMLVKNPVLHSRTKHIALRWHFIRYKLKTNELRFEHVSTECNQSDILTKFLDKARFTQLRDAIFKNA